MTYQQKNKRGPAPRVDGGQVLRLLLEGYKDREMAAAFGVPIATVRWHVRNAYASGHVVKARARLPNSHPLLDAMGLTPEVRVWLQSQVPEGATVFDVIRLIVNDVRAADET